MIIFKIRKDSINIVGMTPEALGQWMCENLVGNPAFINNDIVINYDGDPDYIIVILGKNEDDPLELTLAKV